MEIPHWLLADDDVNSVHFFVHKVSKFRWFLLGILRDFRGNCIDVDADLCILSSLYVERKVEGYLKERNRRTAVRIQRIRRAKRVHVQKLVEIHQSWKAIRHFLFAPLFIQKVVLYFHSRFFEAITTDSIVSLDGNELHILDSLYNQKALHRKKRQHQIYFFRTHNVWSRILAIPHGKRWLWRWS